MAFPQSILPIAVELQINGVWTDVSADARGTDGTSAITIQRGITSSGGTVADRGTCSLTLDNNSGKYSSPESALARTSGTSAATRRCGCPSPTARRGWASEREEVSGSARRMLRSWTSPVTLMSGWIWNRRCGATTGAASTVRRAQLHGALREVDQPGPGLVGAPPVRFRATCCLNWTTNGSRFLVRNLFRADHAAAIHTPVDAGHAGCGQRGRRQHGDVLHVQHPGDRGPVDARSARQPARARPASSTARRRWRSGTCQRCSTDHWRRRSFP
jgi:hypothetical protein